MDNQQDEKGKNKSKQQQTFSPPSSPTHEFSFTISLHQSKSPPSTSALDLSPADDIFFHGHLLPLRLLSHLSPSLEKDTFTLPIKGEEKGNKAITSSPNVQTRERLKPKSFSFFGLQTRRRKGSTEVREKDERYKKRRKLSFNMGHVIRRYMRVIRPLFFIRSKRESMGLRNKPHSFSGYFSPRKVKEARERRGGVSAPASMWTSPRNSTKSDSTMEDLQEAIQAAIAHCKNSVAMNEKFRS